MKYIHTHLLFKPNEFEQITKISNHIVFNSFAQLDRYKENIKSHNSLGLRINPEYSSVKVDLYNPCGTYSRLGITKKRVRKKIKQMNF